METLEQRRWRTKADKLDRELERGILAAEAKDPVVRKAREEESAAQEALERARVKRCQLECAVDAAFKLANKDRYAEVESLRSKARANLMPPKVAEFIQRLHRGVDWGPKGWVCVWSSKHHAILRNPGASFWADRLSGSKYGATKTYLFDLRVEGSGIALTYTDSACRAKYEGRMPKALLKEWQDKALSVEKAADGR